MNFYPLGPLAYMNAICRPGYRYHMVLAQHLYDKDYMPTDYFMYYRRRCSMRGYHVILDNGAYEGELVNYELLIRATLELQPHVVILPDVPHNMEMTIAGGNAFQKLLKKHHWQGKTMTVVHAEPGNLEQFCESYEKAVMQSPWVGISRLTEDFGTRPKNEGDSGYLLRRAEFLQELLFRKLYQLSHKHHALGMRDGSIEELVSLAQSNLFNSCDSSSPIWRGLVQGEKDFDPNFSPIPGSRVTLDIARDNFERVLQACK